MNPRLISTVGIFAGLSTLLAYLDFNLPFFPPFMKLDFADFPSLIIAFAFGPGAGMLVQLIRNCVHLFSTTTGGIGELANMLIGCAMTGTAGYIYQQHHNKKGAAWGLLLGGLVMCLVALPVNYFILLPLFSSFLPLETIINLASKFVPGIQDKYTFILYATLPFNLLKASLTTFLTWLVYKRLHPLLPRKNP